eukprot:gene11789-62183_t
MADHNERRDLQGQVDQREQALRHRSALLNFACEWFRLQQRPPLRHKEELHAVHMDELRKKEQGLHWTAMRDDHIASLEQALRERDLLLQAKEREAEAKEQRAAEKEREL